MRMSYLIQQFRVALAVLGALCVVTSAQAAIERPPPPCQTEAHRAFDFWLGEWEVTTPARPEWKAINRITVGNGGCSIHESYETPSGYKGSSVNFYDATKKLWHQSWIDNQGNPLYLSGNPDGTRMVLASGANEITWTPLEDGRVRQHWQLIDEATGERKTVFDGYYRRITDTP